MATVAAYVGSFVKRSGTGTQDVTGLVDEFGFPFVPKGFLFWSVCRTATGFEDADQRQVFGFSDGSSHVSISHLSNFGSLDTSVGFRNDSAISIVDIDESFNSIGSVSAVASGQFTVNWTTAVGFTGILINFVAFGGSGVGVVAGQASMSGSTGNQSVTGLSIAPSVVLLFPSLNTPAIVSSSGFGPNGLGWFTSTAQGAVSNDTALAGSPKLRRYQRTDRCLVAAGAGGVACEASSVSLNSDGFTINWLTAHTGRIAYLAISGVSAAAGAIVAPTTSGSASIVFTGRLLAGLFMADGTVATTSIDTVQSSLGVGACDVGGNQRVNWSVDGNNAGGTERYESTTASLVTAQRFSSLQSVGSASITPTVLSIAWTISVSDQAQFLYLLIGEATTTTEPTFIDGTVSHPLTWIEHYKEDPTNSIPASQNIAYAEIDLNDRSTYYLGYKAAIVLEWAKVTRGLSDHQGTLEHLSFGCTFSDTTRYFRGLLTDSGSPISGMRFLTNRPMVERMIDDEQRRVEGVPRLIANGFLSDYEPQGGLKFRVACSDWLKRKGTRSRKTFNKWQPLVLPVDFDVNTTPQGVLNKPAPVIYGTLSTSTGAFAPIYTGIRLCSDAVHRSEFLIAAHACKGIPTSGSPAHHQVYVDDVQVSEADLTANFKLPNTAAFISLFSHGYAEFSGRRYTTMYIDRTHAVALNLVTADETGPGTSRLTINIQGIETVGDCTGTLITSLVLQCQHFAENQGDIPWNSTGWVNASPFFFSAIPALTLVDRTSFATVDALVGLTGAGVIGWNGEAVSVLDALARFCLSGDFEIGFSRKGQLIAAYEPASAPGGLSAVDDVFSVATDTLTITDDVSGRFWNIQPYRYGEDYSGKQTGQAVFVNGVRIVPPNSGGWQSVLDGNVEVRDSASISNYDQEIEGSSLDMHFIRNATDALAVATRRLHRYRNPFRTVNFTVPLSGTGIDLGDIFTLSAIDGLTAVGWTTRALRCIRHELDPNTNTVTIGAYDYQRILNG